MAATAQQQPGSQRAAVVRGNQKDVFITVKVCEMADDMRQATVNIIKSVMAQHSDEKEVALNIKHEMDGRLSPSWHVIVGRAFGSFITHESDRFIYVYANNFAIMIFKSA